MRRSMKASLRKLKISMNLLNEEHYAGIARAKFARELATENVGHHQATGDDEDEDTADKDGIDPGGIYSRQSDEDDGNFSYHDSKA